MTKYDRPLSPSEIRAIRDEDIDFSDIPELDETFWQNAELVKPDRTEQITLRIKRSVLDHFRATGKGYQTRINQVLESYVRAREHHR
ncbi:MAG: BrnA antitoxin family protein [Gammaproteobacteria bacterium]|nr:BrnA antitoxin family protein [Gammaproteobacteria bacterium]